MKKIKIAFVLLFAAAMAFAIYLLVGTKPIIPTEGHYTYTIIDGNAMIKSCDRSLSGDVTIPATLGGFPVTSIGKYAFDGCTKITSITIPDSVQDIQMYAFENCTSLIRVDIPYSVKSMDADVFNNCSSLTGIWVDTANPIFSNDAFGVLYNKDKTTLIRAPMNLADPYTIPNNVKTIGDRAFLGCANLTKITIPDGITSIDWYAFSNCVNLTTIVIPKSMTSIGYEVFNGCDNLAAVNYKGSADDWKSMVIKNGNTSLTSAKIKYNFCEHILDTGVITKESTCKESGIRTYSCTLCDYTEMRAIPKLTEHSWNDGQITKQPTCKDEGVKTYTCTICNAKETESVEKLSTHTFDNGITTKEPTCKETGIMTYTCKICQFAKEEVLEMQTSHTPGEPATETTDQVCTVCGKVLMPATGEAEPIEPTDDDSSSGGFFGAIIDFFSSIGAFFENLFASFMSLFGL